MPTHSLSELHFLILLASLKSNYVFNFSHYPFLKAQLDFVIRQFLARKQGNSFNMALSQFLILFTYFMGAYSGEVGLFRFSGD